MCLSSFRTLRHLYTVTKCCRIREIVLDEVKLYFYGNRVLCVIKCLLMSVSQCVCVWWVPLFFCSTQFNWIDLFTIFLNGMFLKMRWRQWHWFHKRCQFIKSKANDQVVTWLCACVSCILTTLQSQKVTRLIYLFVQHKQTRFLIVTNLTTQLHTALNH